MLWKNDFNTRSDFYSHVSFPVENSMQKCIFRVLFFLERLLLFLFFWTGMCVSFSLNRGFAEIGDSVELWNVGWSLESENIGSVPVFLAGESASALGFLKWMNECEKKMGVAIGWNSILQSPPLLIDVANSVHPCIVRVVGSDPSWKCQLEAPL